VKEARKREFAIRLYLDKWKFHVKLTNKLLEFLSRGEKHRSKSPSFVAINSFIRHTINNVQKMEKGE